MTREQFEKIKKIITVNCDITDYYEDDDGDETDEPCRYALGAESLKDSVIKICNVIEQAKKDTAREILQKLKERFNGWEVTYYNGCEESFDYADEMIVVFAQEEYGIDLTEKE